MATIVSGNRRNRAIITELQIDGRRSYTAIAERVGLSEAAVRQRVQRLTEDGVMQIVAVTDPMRLGFKRVAMIAIRVSGDATAVADALTKVPEVGYVVTTAPRGTGAAQFDASTRPMAELLFSPHFAYTFLATSVLILAALVGAVVLAKKDEA